jgi:hypothetical protein
MSRILVGDIPWLSVGEWEARERGGWPDFPDVLESLAARVHSVEGAADVVVLYVCGSDHGRYCQDGFAGRGLGVVIVPRAGDVEIKGDPDRLVFSAPPSNQDVEHISSTRLRQALVDGNFEEARSMVGDGVLQYCRSHQLYGDWTKEPDQRKFRYVFISASSLARQWRQVPEEVLEEALFFFGSKRRWLFPSDPEQVSESMEQPGQYHLMDREFLDIILKKESRGEVIFLKHDDLRYRTYPGPPDTEAYQRVSVALSGETAPADPASGERYRPLLLDPEWWREKGRGWSGFRWEKNPEFVIQNFCNGYHDYNEVMELLYQSNPTLRPILSWPPED